MLSSHHQTLHLARPGIQKACHFWKSGECDVSLRKGFFLLPPIPLCVPTADWQLGMGVCVGGDRIHLLSAWLYMVCFVYATPGQRWHIEVFISRKQVVEERDEPARVTPSPSSPVCASALHQLVHCKRIMEGVHVSACMCVNVHYYILARVILGGLLQRRINQWCLG